MRIGVGFIEHLPGRVLLGFCRRFQGFQSRKPILKAFVNVLFPMLPGGPRDRQSRLI